MSTTIRGTLVPKLQTESWDYHPQRGEIYNAEYKGASQEQMLALAQEYAADGCAVRLTNNQGDTASLIVQDSSGSYTIDTWQVLGNQELRDIWRHPASLAAGLSKDQMIALRRGLDNHTDDTTLFGVGGALAAFAGSVIRRFYNDCVLGSTEFKKANYVLRHTTNAPSRWAVNIADIGIDCNYTPAQLISECSNPSLWIYPLPIRLQYKLANIPAPAAVPYYQWGWLKDPSTETTAADNRIDISTEYVLDQWSTDRYPPY